MGGMIPYFSGKIGLGFRQIFFGAPGKNPVAEEAGLKKPPVEYFKMLYADTALGEVAPTRCGHAFFGTSQCLFASDAPFDSEQGRGLLRRSIDASVFRTMDLLRDNPRTGNVVLILARNG